MSRDYSQEPPDAFTPLPPELAISFYNMEMADYRLDIPFYRTYLPPAGSILELGCGSGRLAQFLGDCACTYLGLDLNFMALRLGSLRRNKACHYICGDMRRWALATRFKTIIIGYNTLNLLTSRGEVHDCLAACHEHLLANGVLLVQLYIATAERRQSTRRSFQFQMLPIPEGGRIIKEILRKYQHISQTMLIEERYRVRPAIPDPVRVDYQSHYTISAWDIDSWLSHFREAGFTTQGLYRDSKLAPYDHSSSTLFGVFTPCG
jgi:SAM-dependent methyltransferase